ncbi:MAG TPA: Hsp20/alpha crystallin family protein [Dehalococcoidia bacterium]|nr:Hsp20/alpha crystallin family protein [Dehalococcoidia bacterium]
MTSVVRWDPFSDLRTTMDRLFDEGFSRPWRLLPNETSSESGFAVEVSETESDIEVKAALPGIRPEDVDITVANDVLTIKAEHKYETEDKKRDYYRRELRYGAFHRSMSLPVSVDADKAEASFENGLLKLRLPKAEALRPRQIKVTNGAS